MSLAAHLHLPIYPSSPEHITPFLRPATIADKIDEGRGHMVPYDAICKVTEEEIARKAQRVNVGYFVVTHELDGAEDHVAIKAGTVIELTRGADPLDDKSSVYYLSYAGDNYPFSAPTSEEYIADKRIAAIGLCSRLGHPVRHHQR